MNEFFKSTNFRSASLDLIKQANKIITEYTDDGYDLTLRQLYYQFVSRDIIANKQSEYDKLGKLMSNARLAGMVDWDAIKDRTREMRENLHWDDPSEPIRSAAYYYKIDTRIDQPHYIEVWVEKEALAGIIERVALKLDIPWFACRGYVSQTAMYEASKRFQSAIEDDKEITIIHLGDHDPSGVDMTRDIFDRQDLFVGDEITVNRIALNMDQVEQYSPPPNPAKFTDSRCGGYVQKYGSESWELDALEPKVLANLITDTVDDLTDHDLRDARLEQQRHEKHLIGQVAENWSKITKELK